MRIAIASSELGHIARGIETWALSLSQPLTRSDIPPDINFKKSDNHRVNAVIHAHSPGALDRVF